MLKFTHAPDAFRNTLNATLALLFLAAALFVGCSDTNNNDIASPDTGGGA